MWRQLSKQKQVITSIYIHQSCGHVVINKCTLLWLGVKFGAQKGLPVLAAGHLPTSGQGLGHFCVSTAKHCALQKCVPAFPCLGAMCLSSWLLFPGVQAAGWSTGNSSGWHLAWLEHLGQKGAAFNVFFNDQQIACFTFLVKFVIMAKQPPFSKVLINQSRCMMPDSMKHCI